MSEGTSGGSAGGGGGIAHPPPQEDQQNLIESFCGITSSTPAEAIFFLESHSWQLDAALQSFDAAAHDDTARSLRPAVAAAASRPAAPASRRQLQEEEEDDEDYVPPAADESPRQHPPTRSTVAAMASSSGTGRSSKPFRASDGPNGKSCSQQISPYSFYSARNAKYPLLTCQLG